MTTASAKRSTAKRTPAKIDALHRKARLARQRAEKHHHELVLAWLDLGETVVALQAGIEAGEAGEWLPMIEKMDFAERSVQPMTKLVGTALAKLIRTGNQALIAGLPLDLQSLEMLARLPAAKLHQALRGWDLGNLTAMEIAQKTSEALALKSPKKATGTGNHASTKPRAGRGSKQQCKGADEPGADDDRAEHEPDGAHDDSELDTDYDVVAYATAICRRAIEDL